MSECRSNRFRVLGWYLFVVGSEEVALMLVLMLCGTGTVCDVARIGQSACRLRVRDPDGLRTSRRAGLANGQS
jgi:hypothetical protein